MIFTQPVKCPHCGYERMHSWDPAHNGSNNRIVQCEATVHHNGCGRYFALFWNVMAIVDARRIEGQEETQPKAAE